ncbi:2067_t:CDS:2 [Paraglomus brasilianum]|uniref:2067_t:CDS:1 n=1 Tax=Paraglomus brasilianum TaxID=144538 RepID=A0A9N9F372_9GLOM|nr:2067_t:CDS:2 [Paraglomus brasilianum]
MAIIGATLFILFGLVLLVDCAYTWNEKCLERWDESGDNKWKYILIGSTLTLYIGALILTILMYKYFAGSQCHMNQFFITFNLILCCLVTFLSVHPTVQEQNSQSGLSQSSMVVIYSTYLIASAVVNEPDDHFCNPLIRSRGTQTATMITGALFTFLAIAYSTSRAATQGKALITKSDYHPLNTATAVPLVTNIPNGSSSSSGRSDALLAAVETMYVAMLLTNWNTISTSNSDELVIIGQSYTAVWVKTVSSWVCLLIFAWTLVAPVVFPERFTEYQ